MTAAVVAPAAVPAVAVPARRLAGLDRVRGLAVLCMVVDHLCIVLDLGAHGEVARLTVGRVAMPLFFLVAGSLVRSLSWRHVGIVFVGAALPLLVPWIDSPNVLVLYVAGVMWVVVADRFGWPVWLPAVPALAVLANGWTLRAGGFDPLAAVALLALGAQVGPAAFRWGRRIPWWLGLGLLGRFPLTVYVGHLLALVALDRWVL